MTQWFHNSRAPVGLLEALSTFLLSTVPSTNSFVKEETTGHFCIFLNAIFLNATPSAEKNIHLSKGPWGRLSSFPGSMAGRRCHVVHWFCVFPKGLCWLQEQEEVPVLPLRTMTPRHHELGRFEATRTYFLRFRRLNPGSQHHPIRYGPRACLSVQRRSRCVPICWRQQEKRKCSEEG